jgi:hypothetical protein
VTPLQVATEEYLARKYCEPKAYWHCTKQLDGSTYYTFEEINYPRYWLHFVAKYIQQQPSAAARQLHRRVEAARAEFNAKQERAWGNRRVGTHPAYEKQEAAAWNTFNAQKQAYLKEYLRVIKSGIVRRIRSRKCKMCNAAPVLGRTQYCEICRKQRNRESYRISKAQKRSLMSKSCVLQPA